MQTAESENRISYRITSHLKRHGLWFAAIFLALTAATPDNIAMAQTTMSSTPDSVAFACKEHDQHQLNYKKLVAPAVLTGIGIVGLESDWLKYQNREMRDELQENIDRKFTIDDLTQYAPMASVYALSLCGLKAKHTYRDRTIILATSALVMGAVVNGLKYTTKVMRPDASTRNSFPSGHTAMAFMGAELLRREYQDVSPWIGIAGYAVATGTGFFRMYNNRHWFTDVIAGAGIGILSTEIGYWAFPAVNKFLQNSFGKKKANATFMASPYVTNEARGVNLLFLLH